MTPNEAPRIPDPLLLHQPAGDGEQAQEGLSPEREIAGLRFLPDQAERILESITDAFFALDREWRFTYLNRQAEEVLMRQPGELLGFSIWDVYPGLEGSEFEECYRRTVREGVASSFTSYYPPHDRWYEVHAYPASEGLTVYFRDATESKRSEITLKESEERYRLLAAELSLADRKKDEFLALLAHELRNPLAPLRTGLEIIEKLPNDHPSAAKTRGAMARQLAHLVRLIDDLLDVSRLGMNKMELRRIRADLSDIFNSAVETAMPAIEGFKHQLTIRFPEDSIFLDADATRLAQVISNLLLNSAKYTAPGGQILLSGRVESNKAEISVSDNGIGIPLAVQDSIFEMFTQVDHGLERRTDGLGIGLALVKGLVELHGGSVSVASPGKNQGSTFTVFLPLLEESLSVPDTGRDVQSLRRVPTRRILVVDDNRDAAVALASLLEILGNEIATAHDGEAAIERSRSFRPDVIFMDIGMPGLSGYEATRRIRREPWGAKIRIVALTGWGKDSDRVDSKQAGCDFHLVKPVRLVDVEAAMADVSL